MTMQSVVLEISNIFTPTIKKGDKFYNLCVYEKKWIAKLAGPERLNSNDEFVKKCPHMWEFRLGRIKNSSEIDLLKHTINDNAISSTGNIQPTTVVIPRINANQTVNNSTTGTNDLIDAFYHRRSSRLQGSTPNLTKQ